MSDTLQGRYHGQAGPLFGLYIKTAFLTLITLGIYRFWGKTRIRKYIWSGTTGDGDSFEYTGTGLEKFLGFLIAVVILAIYLGIVQMFLLFFGIWLFDEPETPTEVALQVAGFYITFFAAVPLIFFAQYRSRRYKMARTRWRGLRFGMDSAAGGYVWRAICHTLLTILTLGILIPRQTFYLEKYMADRTWYGDAKFQQNGRWQALFPGLKHIVIALVVLIGGVAIAVSVDAPGIAMVAMLVGYVWLAIGAVYYRVYAFNTLTREKVLDDAVTFRSEARTGEVVKITIVGGLVIAGIGIVAGAIVAGIGYAMFQTMLPGGGAPMGISESLGIVIAILTGILYVGVILLIGGVSLVLITQKIIGHLVDNVTVQNAPHLDTIRQRSADAGADADGFADALDIGGAI